MKKSHQRVCGSVSSAFSLIELLVSLTVIAVLAAILMSVVGRMRSSAQGISCLGNLRQLGSASLLYINEHQNMTPPLGVGFYRALWPYLYSDQQLDLLAVAGTGLPGEPIAGSVFECPAASQDDSPYVTIKRSYGANSQLVPGAENKDTEGVDVTMVTEPTQAVLFGDVRNSSALRPGTVNGRHSGVMNVVFVDGHTGAIEVTDALTATPTWNTDPFWIGIRR